MSSLPPSASSATVRNILSLLASRNAQLVAGMGGLERRVTWACRMRVRLPAFESIQGEGIKCICEQLDASRGKWVIVPDAEEQVRFQAAPAQSEVLSLPMPLTDEALRQQGLMRVVEPILIRHEVVGYLSVVGNES